MARIGGFRRKSRHKLKKSRKNKGKVSLTRYLQKLDIGQKVLLSAEPAVQKGMYHPIYMGKSGTVKGIQGRCYKVEIKDIGKNKTLLIHPVHLKKL